MYLRGLWTRKTDTTPSAGRRPSAPRLDLHHDCGAGQLHPLVLGIALAEEVEDLRQLRVGVDDAGGAVGPDPPQPPPCLLVVVDQQRDTGIGFDVLEPMQPVAALWLSIHRADDEVAID